MGQHEIAYGIGESDGRYAYMSMRPPLPPTLHRMVQRQLENIEDGPDGFVMINDYTSDTETRLELFRASGETWKYSIRRAANEVQSMLFEQGVYADVQRGTVKVSSEASLFRFAATELVAKETANN